MIVNKSFAAITLVVLCCAAHSPVALAQATSDPRLGAVVEVGANGNEPLIFASPDGTLYISALQYIYRSKDKGRTWQPVAGPFAAGTVLASDSSIWVAPGGRLYFSFDYPYAGVTAACTSDDQGDTFACANAALPGVTDRMWVYAPTQNDAYLTTNEGLYQTTMAVSHDGGVTYTPFQFGGEPLQPQTGPLLSVPGSSDLLQAIKLDTQSFYVYSETNTPLVPITETRSSDLANTNAILSTALSADKKLFLVGEEPNAAGGKQLVLGYSADEARTWKRLPPIPQTTTGSATFSWVAAGKAGHVGVIYFYTPQGVDPTITVDAPWSALWAETFNALDTTPQWQVFTLEKNVHAGAICAAADCMGNARFAGDFINATFDANENAHLTWMIEDADSNTHVRYAQVAAKGGATTPTVPTTPTTPATPVTVIAPPPVATTAVNSGAQGRFGGGALGLSLLPLLLLAGLRRRR